MTQSGSAYQRDHAEREKVRTQGWSRCGSPSTRSPSPCAGTYPLILLNLAFSTQAAYAAPLILLAQKRQAERDKDAGEQAEAHHEELARGCSSARRRSSARPTSSSHYSTRTRISLGKTRS
ncbi:MAG: DUF1003 domain-containing protein [Actinobacteria bacterium]|nr:MAG: DUF1003 domain-containing protein [Actinomycetota bacterium]